MAKNFHFNENIFIINSPSEVDFENEFFRNIYSVLYNEMENESSQPHIDFDELSSANIGFSFIN